MLMADLIQRSDPWQFLAHRIVRIYPTFLLAVLVSAPLLAFVGGFGLAFHGLSLLLVPAGVRPYYLGVEWTLVFECTYYVALFIIAVAGWRRYLNWLALTWLAAILAAPLFIGWNDNCFCYFYSIWLVPSDAAFAGGLLIPWIGRNVRIPVGTGILACSILMAAPPANPVVARWAAGVAAALLVLDAARIKRPPLPGLHRLGDWSYALYLVHASTIWIVYRFWPTAAGAGLALLFAVATALLVAASFGMLDVWLHRYLKNMVDALGKDVRQRRVNIYVGVFILASLTAAFMT
jgi:exopolysaccharide production protein ExoZ